MSGPWLTRLLSAMCSWCIVYVLIAKETDAFNVWVRDMLSAKSWKEIMKTISFGYQFYMHFTGVRLCLPLPLFPCPFCAHSVPVSCIVCSSSIKYPVCYILVSSFLDPRVNRDNRMMYLWYYSMLLVLKISINFFMEKFTSICNYLLTLKLRWRNIGQKNF